MIRFLQTKKASLAIVFGFALFALNCSGKTYQTFLNGFNLSGTTNTGGSGGPGGAVTANPSTPISVSSATPLTPTRVKLQLTKPVTLASGENASNYVVTDGNGARLDILAVTRDPFDSSIVYFDTSLQSSGGTYTVTVSNLLGVDGAALSSSANTASWTGPSNVDLTAPTINATSTLTSTTISVTFSEALTTTTVVAANFRYYTSLAACTGDGTFTAGTLATSVAIDPTNTAKLTVTTGALGVGPYVVGTRNTRDIWGNAVASPTCSATFNGTPAAPRVLSAVSFSSTSMLVTFDQAMTNNATLTTRTNYVLSGCGALSTAPTATVTPVGATNPAQVTISGLTAGTVGSCKLAVTTSASMLSSAGVQLSATNNVAFFNYATADTTSPAVLSVTPTSSTNVRITFNEPINDATVDISDFVFSPSLTVGGVACFTGAGNYVYCDVTTSAQTTQSYGVTVSGINDVAGNAVTSSTASFAGDGKPYIIAIIPVDSTTVRVQWSEPITAAGVQAGDYTVAGATVTAAALFPAGSNPSDMVQLTVTGMTGGNSYTVGFTDTSTSTVDSTGNTVALPTIPSGGGFTAPTLSVLPAITGITNLSTQTVRVTFNKALDNFTIATTDFSLAGGGLCPTVVNSASQVSAGVVVLNVTQTAALADIACTVSMAGSSVTDITGNNIAATGAVNYTYTGTGAGADTTAPSIVSINPLSSTQFVINFSEPVTAGTGQTLTNYSISPQIAATGTGFPAGTTIACSGFSCTVTLSSAMSGSTYTVTATGVQDASGNAITGGSATFSGISGSTPQPSVYLASLINSTTVEVSFTEAMDYTAATNTANYSVSGGLTITAASIQSDPTKVHLTFSSAAVGSGNTYTVTGSGTGLKDVAGNFLTSPLSASFTGSASAPSSAPDLAAGSDKGVSNTDNTTGASAFPPGISFTGTVAANTTVVIYANGIAVGSATSDGSGNYTVVVATAPTPDGSYIYTLGTVSATGQVSDQSSGITVNYDSSAPGAPATAIDLAAASDTGSSNSDNITKTSNGLVFTGSGAVANATVRVYAGAVEIGSATADGAGGWSITTTVALSEGANTITFKIEDIAGNLSAVSTSSLSVTLDTAAPATPGTADLQVASDTGSSTTDNITSATTPSFDVTCAVGSGLVQLYDNGTATGTAVNCVASPVTVTTAGLTDGSHTITAIQTDAAGNASTVSSGLTVTVDSGFPAVTGTPDMTDASDTGSSSSDNNTSNTTPAFTVTCETGTSVQLYATNTVPTTVATGAAVACAGGTATLTAAALASGSYTIHAVQTDTAGNASGTSATLSITIDATVPAVSTGAGNGVSSTNANGNYGLGQTIAVTVKFTEVVYVNTTGGTPTLTLSTTSPATTAVNYTSGSGTNTLTFDFTVATGNSNADLDYAATTSLALNGGTISDAAGNNATLTLATPGAGNVGSLANNKDLNVSAVPSGAITYAQGGNTTGPFKAGSLTITATYAVDPGATPTIAINQPGTTDISATAMSVTSATVYTYTYTINTATGGTYIDGLTTITLSTLSSNNTFTIDTVANATGTPDMTAGTDTGSSSTDNITNNATPSFTVTCETGASVQLYDNVTATGSAVTCAGGTATLTAATLSNGTHATMNAIQTDAAGNVSPASGNLSVTIDTGTPATPSGLDLVAASDTGTSSTDDLTKNTTLTISVVCEVGASVQLYDGGTATGAAVNCGASPVDVTTGTLSEGTHSAITARQTDTAGNATTDSASFSVTIDATVPTVTIASTASDPTTTSPIPFTFTFSESVTGFVVGDITVTNGTAGNFSGSGASYSADITPSGNPVTVTVAIAASVATDTAGNNNAAATSVNRTYNSGATAFTISSADTMDCDLDGHIDHYKITLSHAVTDSTMNGYTGTTNYGNATDTEWIISDASLGQYVNVRFSPPAKTNVDCTSVTDTANDAIIYVIFNEKGAYDTGVKPDITGSSTTLVRTSDTVKLNSNTGNWTSTFVTETDKAGPIVVAALGAEGGALVNGLDAGDTLTLTFSEAMTNYDFKANSVDLDAVFTVGGVNTKFAAITDITSTSWSAGNTQLIITFANATPTIALADTIKGLNTQANLTDTAANVSGNIAAGLPTILGTFDFGNKGPVVTAVEYKDTNHNGYIDHAKITFDINVDATTFPGYAATSLGTSTTFWQVVGYANVKLDTRTTIDSTTSEGDASDSDNVLWIAFSESSDPDTGSKPDLTATTGSAALRGTAGVGACYINTTPAQCSTAASASLTSTQFLGESDAAPPVIVFATGSIGGANLYTTFSEPVWTNTGMSGNLVASDFTYDNDSATNVSAVSSMGSDADGSVDGFVILTVNTNFVLGDFSSDKLGAAASEIFDAANIAALTANTGTNANEKTILEATKPYLLTASSYYSGTKYYLRVLFSEPVTTASATNVGNYTITTLASCTPAVTATTAVTQVGGTRRIYDLETTAQGSTCTYQIVGSSAILDVNEGAPLTLPNTVTTVGTASTDVTRPRLLLATATSLTTVLLSFSEPMKSGDVTGSAECAGTYATAKACTFDWGTSQLKYTLTPPIGTTGSVLVASNSSEFILTTTSNQTGAFYTVSVQSAVANVVEDAAGQDIGTSPNNLATFQGLGSAINNFTDGPIFDNPFADGTTFSFAFTYSNRVYLGPNDINTGAFRFEADGTNPITVTHTGPAAGGCASQSTFGYSTIATTTLTGTITATSASATVTGAGTNFTGQLVANDYIRIQGVVYEISSVGSATSLTLKSGFSGTTASGLTAHKLAYTNPASCTTGALFGPNSERGLVGFNSGTVTLSSVNYEFLMVGTIKDNVGYSYFSQDTDTNLDYKQCTFSATGGANTKAIQTMYAFGDSYYVGLSTNHGTQAPILFRQEMTQTGGVLSCGSATGDLTLRAVNRVGKNAGGSSNPAADSAAVVGIDSMIYIPTGGGPTPTDTFYVANNGGLVYSTGAPTGSGSFAVAFQQSDLGGTTLVLPDAGSGAYGIGLEKIRPGQRGIPVMTVYKGNLYMARNLASAQTALNETVNNGAELWKCTALCTTNTSWKKVVSIVNFSGGANNKSIGMLQVNGNYLYMGLDNYTDGIRIFRTDVAEIDSTTSLTGNPNGSDLTANSGDGHKDFVTQVTPGVTNPTQFKVFFSSASLTKSGSSYVYVTVMDGQNAINVLRQVD